MSHGNIVSIGNGFNDLEMKIKEAKPEVDPIEITFTGIMSHGGKTSYFFKLRDLKNYAWVICEEYGFDPDELIKIGLEKLQAYDPSRRFEPTEHRLQTESDKGQ